MSDLIKRQDVINALECNFTITGEYNAKTVYKVLKKICDKIKSLPTAQPDFDITVKIDKAYDEGYEARYLQGRHDWGDLDE